MKRPELFTHLVFVLAGMLLAANAPAGDYPVSASWGGDNCYANCVSLYRHGDRLFVIGKDAAGKVVATGQAAVGSAARGPMVVRDPGSGATPRSATGARPQNGLPVSGTCLGTTGTCVDQSVLRFETATHLIIVTVTYFFFNGELHDIDVREKRFAKDKIK